MLDAPQPGGGTFEPVGRDLGLHRRRDSADPGRAHRVDQSAEAGQPLGHPGGVAPGRRGGDIGDPRRHLANEAGDLVLGEKAAARERLLEQGRTDDVQRAVDVDQRGAGRGVRLRRVRETFGRRLVAHQPEVILGRSNQADVDRRDRKCGCREHRRHQGRRLERDLEPWFRNGRRLDPEFDHQWRSRFGHRFRDLVHRHQRIEHHRLDDDLLVRHLGRDHID